MSRTRRRLAVLLAALAFAGLAWWAFSPAAVPVEVGEVTRGPLQITVDEEGETRVRQRFVVAAPASGRLLRIQLDEGDLVAAGDVVARIVPAPLDPREVRAAEARLAAAEDAKQGAAARAALADAALAQAERDLTRAEKLREAGARSDEELDRARLERTRALREREAARFATAAADHEVEAARAVLMATRSPRSSSTPYDDPCATAGSCIEVRAPIAGPVLRVHEESERIVVAGAPLLELGDPESIEIVVDVLSADAVKIRPGAELWVEDWGGPHPLRATVRRVEPSGFTKVSALGVEEQRVNVIADFVDRPDGLGDGFRVEARIVVWHGDDVLRVPSSALFRHGEGWAVFRVEGGVARTRDVGLGQRGPFEAELVDGLAPGDAVVLHPSDRLADGLRVRAR